MESRGRSRAAIQMNEILRDNEGILGLIIHLAN